MAELVDYERSHHPEGFAIVPPDSTSRDLIILLERAGYIVSGRRVWRVDDSVSRPLVNFSCRIVRVSGSLSSSSVEVLGNGTLLEMASTMGVYFPITQTQEREYFDDSIPVQGQGDVVARSRKVVKAGLNGFIEISPLQDYRSRLSGTIEVSAFSGSSTQARTVSSTTLDHDVPRDEWFTVLTFVDASGGFLAAIGEKPSWNLGGVYFALQVRVW